MPEGVTRSSPPSSRLVAHAYLESSDRDVILQDQAAGYRRMHNLKTHVLLGGCSNAMSRIQCAVRNWYHARLRKQRRLQQLQNAICEGEGIERCAIASSEESHVAYVSLLEGWEYLQRRSLLLLPWMRGLVLFHRLHMSLVARIHGGTLLSVCAVQEAFPHRRIIELETEEFHKFSGALCQGLKGMHTCLTERIRFEKEEAAAREQLALWVFHRISHVHRREVEVEESCERFVMERQWTDKRDGMCALVQEAAATDITRCARGFLVRRDVMRKGGCLRHQRSISIFELQEVAAREDLVQSQVSSLVDNVLVPVVFVEKIGVYFCDCEASLQLYRTAFAQQLTLEFAKSERRRVAAAAIGALSLLCTETCAAAVAAHGHRLDIVAERAAEAFDNVACEFRAASANVVETSEEAFRILLVASSEETTSAAAATSQLLHTAAQVHCAEASGRRALLKDEDKNFALRLCRLHGSTLQALRIMSQRQLVPHPPKEEAASNTNTRRHQQLSVNNASTEQQQQQQRQAVALLFHREREARHATSAAQRTERSGAELLFWHGWEGVTLLAALKRQQADEKQRIQFK